MADREEEKPPELRERQKAETQVRRLPALLCTSTVTVDCVRMIGSSQRHVVFITFRLIRTSCRIYRPAISASFVNGGAVCVCMRAPVCMYVRILCVCVCACMQLCVRVRAFQHVCVYVFTVALFELRRLVTM